MSDDPIIDLVPLQTLWSAKLSYWVFVNKSSIIWLDMIEHTNYSYCTKRSFNTEIILINILIEGISSQEKSQNTG